MLKLDHVMGVQLYILKLNLALPASACGLGVMTYFFQQQYQAYYCTSTRYRIRSRNARARGSDSGRARILDKNNYDIWTIKTNSKCKIIRYFNKYINQREAVLSNADLKLKFTFRNQKNSYDFTRFLQLSSFATVHRLAHTRTMPGMALVSQRVEKMVHDLARREPIFDFFEFECCYFSKQACSDEISYIKMKFKNYCFIILDLVYLTCTRQFT